MMGLSRTSVAYIAALIVAACAHPPAHSPTARAPSFRATLPAPPPTPIRTVADTLHGEGIVDPYRWIENVADSGVQAWMRAQGRYADSVLSLLPERAAINAEVDSISALPSTRVGRLYRLADGLIYQRRDPGERAARFVVRERFDAADRTLLTPAQLATLGADAVVVSWYPSPDGTHVLMKIVRQGRETGTLRVLDTRTGLFLADSIPNTFDVSNAPWRPDGNAFLYRLADTRQPFRLHELGAPLTEDRDVLGRGISQGITFDSSAWASIEFSPSSPWVVVVLHRASGSDVYVAPVNSLGAERTRWRHVAGPAEGIARAWALHGDALYAMSHRGAKRYRIVRVSLAESANGGATTRQVLAEDTQAVITKPVAASDALYVVRQRDGLSEIVRVPYDGSEPGVVPMPFDGAGAEWGAASQLSPGVVFELRSWAKSPRLFFVSSTDPPVLLDLQPPAASEAVLDVISVEVDARSADGTMVPMSIAYPRGMALDGNHSARLEVYGASGVSVAAYYAPYYAPWYRRGNVQAQCYPRGGGERGADWHEQGRGDHLGNRIADMIACAEYLVAHGYSSRGRIAAVGTSAGGITAGAAAIARPDLFGAAALSIPVLDLLRREFSPGGVLNIAEYGSVRSPAQFRIMRALGPIENVRPGSRYPAMMLTTGINDIRVSPSEPAKLAARLQAANAENIALLFVDFAGGHGLTGPPIADQLAFLLWALTPGGDASRRR